LTAVEPTTNKIAPIRSRRQVLCGLVVALMAPAGLAACSDDAPSAGGGSTGGTTPGGSTGGGGGGSTGAVALADIPDGGGVIVDAPDGSKALVVRNGEEVKAFNAACTHQGTIVDAPQDGVATCPNHQSQFDAETGEVLQGPATQPLAELTVQVEGGQVVLA
jgi:nitrite reductase/ring-hydroxylating ferredoxin subunit